MDGMRDDFSVVALGLDDSVMHVKANSTIRLFSPAKVNLFLAVVGKRDDGFHDLISLVAPISFGDILELSCRGEPGPIELSCTDSKVPLGPENLVVKAADGFRRATGLNGAISIHLEKRIPMEAGLGGGSSNAANTLLALNELNNKPLSPDELTELAARLGSDCPLFLHRSPLVMRGRGERIERLSPTLVESLEGRTLAVFKPSIGISTGWAYGALAKRSERYAQAEGVEKQLLAWKSGGLPLDQLLFNTMEIPVFEKFVAFPALFRQIRSELGLRPLMSGSGSSCFVLLPDSSGISRLQAIVREAFGESALFEVCKIVTDL